MEQRHNRGRGGSWKRGGGSESHQSSGEQRGRGRGGHHRGRGRRDHYRGRGRGGRVADHYYQGQDEADSRDQEDEGFETFSRRKLESNWDRYEAEEKEKLQEEGPTQRGADYHALLGSAGDSFAQFRLSEEKDWEADSLAINQVSAMLVDLQALAQSLQELPLHAKLNLEVELIQATPVELPKVTSEPKRDSHPSGQFRPPPVQQVPAGSLGVSCPVRPVSDNAIGTAVNAKAPVLFCGRSTPQADVLDHELDLLLTLQTSDPDQSQSTNTPEDKMEVPFTLSSPEAEAEVEEETENVKSEVDTKKQEVTEDDLEDWLDSMIS